jgi:plastocyanin
MQQRRRVEMTRRRLHSADPRGYVRGVSPRSTLVVAAALALGSAGVAQAATKSVYLGTPPASQKAFANLSADANAYFPRSITVRRGDKVRFLPTGLHTVELPVKGRAAAPLVSAGAPIAGAKDPAGVAYWFNGQPDLELTPSLLDGTFGKTLSYSGQTAVLSGLPFSTKPLTVKFTKTGTFSYFCNVHSGMKGTVTVRGPASKVPSAKSDAKRVKQQAAAALKEAKSLLTTPLPRNTVQLGNGGRTGAEILAMYPGVMTVPTGTVLTFVMSRFSFEAHTATTGPGDPWTDPSSFLGKMSDSIRITPPFDQAGVYPSDPRGEPALLTPSLHGNGFWNSGFMDRADSTPQPKTSQVKIVAPGTYTFYCMLHPFMKVLVTAT